MYEKTLKKADISGVYHLPPAKRHALEQAAAKIGLSLWLTDFSSCRNMAEALRQLGSTLHFPNWYGVNFDALYDCLTDPDWQAGKGLVLCINGIDALKQIEPEDFTTLIDVLQAASAVRHETGSPCWILLDDPAQGIASLPEA